MIRGVESISSDDQLNFVFDMSQAMASHDDPVTALSAALSCIVANIPEVDSGCVLVRDPHTKLFRIWAGQGYDGEVLQQVEVRAGEYPLIGTSPPTETRVYRSPQEITAANSALRAGSWREMDSASLDARPPQCTLCLPLIWSGETAGVLLLENRRRPDAFTTGHVRFLERLCPILALAATARPWPQRDARQLADTNEEEQCSEVISTLAHEMRTPLASVRGYATAMLMDDVSFSPETQRQFLGFIEEECQTLETLIRDILESSRLPAGRPHLQLQQTVLAHLAGTIIDEVARRSPKHRFLADFPDSLPPLVIDPDRIAQVFRNLLDNAVKYSPDGGLIVVRGEPKGEEAVVSVADQGIGITPNDLNRLFERYFRADTHVGRAIEGSGLGLAICRGIIESHGGRIWADSQPGRGTTLSFSLPFDASGERARGTQA